MRPCGLKLSAMNKRWLPILGMLVFSVSLHGQGSVVVFDEQQRFDVVARYILRHPEWKQMVADK